jgi:hypothetical protein
MTPETDRLARTTQRLAQARHHGHDRAEALLRTQQALLGAQAAIQRTQEALLRAQAGEAEARRERDAILSSTTWRATEILGSLAARLPAFVRRLARAGIARLSRYPRR